MYIGDQYFFSKGHKKKKKKIMVDQEELPTIFVLAILNMFNNVFYSKTLEKIYDTRVRFFVLFF